MHCFDVSIKRSIGKFPSDVRTLANLKEKKRKRTSCSPRPCSPSSPTPSRAVDVAERGGPCQLHRSAARAAGCSGPKKRRRVAAAVPEA